MLSGKRKVYVASSWRNLTQPAFVTAIRKMGHDVYDFKNPAEGDNGFHWSEIDSGWESWDAARYVKALNHPIAEAGFKTDFAAMKWADTFVLVQPCGRSAHLEMGWAVGAGKATIMALGPDIEPELMVKMCDHICVGLGAVLKMFELRLCELCKSDKDVVRWRRSTSYEYHLLCEDCRDARRAPNRPPKSHIFGASPGWSD